MGSECGVWNGVDLWEEGKRLGWTICFVILTVQVDKQQKWLLEMDPF